ncbi:hypothetical protein [Thermogymnomonas acidicola]|nr:hypothetical protein [Thermogymnomonas acidicola]
MVPGSIFGASGPPNFRVCATREDFPEAFEALKGGRWRTSLLLPEPRANQ